MAGFCIFDRYSDEHDISMWGAVRISCARRVYCVAHRHISAVEHHWDASADTRVTAESGETQACGKNRRFPGAQSRVLFRAGRGRTYELPGAYRKGMDADSGGNRRQHHSHTGCDRTCASIHAPEHTPKAQT